MRKGAVVVYPQFSMQEISCLTELFKFYGKEITVFASSLKPVNSEDGFTILPHKTFSDFQRDEYDCIILPGIWDFREALEDNKNIGFLRQFVNDNDIIIASISSSPILLAKAGILDNHKYCGGLFEEVIDEYDFIPRKNLVRKPVCVDTNLVTAIGFAFREFAVETARKVGIDCKDNIFSGVTKEYSEEELTFHFSADFEE
ncbi:DJ-1/PfpI family protein [Clostridiales bacterium oral taxon 876 str. F0540]|nr:DJ-1/PfpI family protein [Clostridiales bacterium oral taxon 876 str. F0540]